jgi:excisionase family DNA binding protein
MATHLTTVQAASSLGITPSRVIAMIRAKRLPAEKVGNQWLIRPLDLEQVRSRKPGRPPANAPAPATPESTGYPPDINRRIQAAIWKEYLRVPDAFKTLVLNNFAGFAKELGKMHPRGEFPAWRCTMEKQGRPRKGK